MKKKITSVLKALIFLSIGVFFVWIFVRKLTAEQIEEIFMSVKTANYWWLLLSFLIGLISHFARSYRSILLLKPMGYNPSFKNSFFAVMVGYFANLALPRLGEVLRCTFLQKYEDIPFQKSFGTIIAERALDLVIFIILFFIGLIIEFERLYGYFQQTVLSPMQQKAESALGNIGLYIIFGLGFLMLIFFFIYRKRLNNLSIFTKFKSIFWGFVEGILSVTRVKQPILFVVLTLAIWSSYFLMTLAAFQAFDGISHLPISAAFSCFNFGTIAFMLVQGGIGIYPAIIAETLKLYDAPFIVSYAAGWVGWSIQTITIIILGLLSITIASVTKSKNGTTKLNK